MAATTAKISLAGDLGSGKSTVADILKERLGVEIYSTGKAFREMAEEFGMTVNELSEHMKSHPEVDKLLDDGLVALSDRDEGLIIDSRMAWRFVKDTFKVYMTVEKWEAAGRIFRNRRPGEPASTVEEAYNNICLRRESEKNRYKEKYGVDITDLGNYSLVVDTTYASPEEVAECILTAFADWQEDHTRSYAYYCPKRFLYPDDEADADRMMKLSALLDSGADAGKVTADEYDGDVYLTSNPEVALAYAMSGLPLVPTVLTAGRKPQGNFVTMRDTL